MKRKPVRYSESLKEELADKVQEATDGVVRGYMRSADGLRTLTTPRLIAALGRGLAVQELDDLRNSLDLPMEKLIPLLGMSKATLHRRKIQGRLEPDESDHVLRFARLMGYAAEVLESPENARRWLSSPQVGLGGAIPLEYAKTEVGARAVEDLLGRIEYGVYS
jgi:putative toxin-antitoxin system antitoxin component (TIGR02293 family)